MNTLPGWPRWLPRWLLYVAGWLALTLVFASQVYWSGYAPWPAALWLEAIHWLSWGIVAPLVFWLCRRLYGGEHTWQRYAIGLLLGALVISILQPFLIESINFAKGMVQWCLSMSDGPPHSFLPGLHVTAVKIAGYNLPFYVVLVLAWHAMTYYSELRDRLPLTGAPATELRGVHVTFPAESFYPEKWWSVSTLGEAAMGVALSRIARNTRH